MRDDASVEPLCHCPCAHLQHLLDVEHRLREALALAREQVLDAEHVLDQLVKARHGSDLHRQLRDPFSDCRAVAAQVQDDDAGDPVDGAPTVVVSTTLLTARETEVLQLIATGLSNRKIADRLFLSPRTIERHIANVYLKLDVHTKAEATAWALVHGLTGEIVVPNGSAVGLGDHHASENYVARLHISTDA